MLCYQSLKAKAMTFRLVGNSVVTVIIESDYTIIHIVQ